MMSPRLKAGFISTMAMAMVMMTLILVGQKTLFQSDSLLASLPSPPAGGVIPGDGLTGTYYGNTGFTNPVLIRIDPEVNFNFGGGSPAPEVPGDFFSVRWTGQVRAEQTGTYTFYTVNDDGAALRIDNQVIINDPNIHPPIENRGVVDLEAGQRYDITLDFFEFGGGAVISLSWEGPQTPKQIIPTRVLYSEATECSDKVDNDGDGLIDFSTGSSRDPGCDSANDNSEQDSNCADSIDNDGDGKIDFPEDPGCDSSSDEDETDPPSAVTINLGSGNNSVDESDNNYPLGIEANRPNEVFVKARVGNRFEFVRMTASLLPSFSSAPTNASIHYYLLQGTDSEGGGHLSVIQGRHWDPTVFANDTLTGEPWHSYFQAGTDLASCAQEMGDRFSAIPFYLDNPFFFQQMIEMLSLCQR
jgi:hypothetical protein